MVQMDEAQELRRRWNEAGSPECDHPELDREYYLGSQTGDRVCLMCGEVFSPTSGGRWIK
jgi:hypothetical protein